MIDDIAVMGYFDCKLLGFCLLELLWSWPFLFYICSLLIAGSVSWRVYDEIWLS